MTQAAKSRPSRRDPGERALEKVRLNGDCWIFEGAHTANGYGQVHNPTGSRLAHRAVYEYLTRQEIPPKATVDHVCRVKSCVNPDHMEIVSNRENILRGGSMAALYARRTHCPRGHPFDGDNLRVYKSDGNSRTCLTCKREASRRTAARARSKTDPIEA